MIYLSLLLDLILRLSLKMKSRPYNLISNQKATVNKDIFFILAEAPPRMAITLHCLSLPIP